MPHAPARLCERGHGRFTGSRCPECLNAFRLRTDAQRASSHGRGYDLAWRKLRAAFLVRNPMCSHRQCDKPATDVDHIIRVRERPDLRLAWSNLRPLCHAHHSQRTARDHTPRGAGRSLAEGGSDRQGSVARECVEISNWQECR